MPAQKGINTSPGDPLGPGNRDVRMKRSEVRLDAGIQDSLLDALVQGKQMGMPMAHSGPHHRRMGSAEGAQSLDREEECRNRNLFDATRNRSRPRPGHHRES